MRKECTQHPKTLGFKSIGLRFLGLLELGCADWVVGTGLVSIGSAEGKICPRLHHPQPRFAEAAAGGDSGCWGYGGELKCGFGGGEFGSLEMVKEVEVLGGNMVSVRMGGEGMEVKGEVSWLVSSVWCQGGLVKVPKVLDRWVREADEGCCSEVRW
ncbi:hypothetical protein V6N11_031350 [Hibiscus sabdariffa]|uniref:Uncharacterized protein n=1 Tax=Hibiscus sabdariffa TaxID=183260 RepID=A0ABR2SXF5_9ROSI